MAQLSARSNKVRKKDICALMKTRAFRTLDKRWPLSFASLPLGETRVREQVAENRFFRNLLKAGALVECPAQLEEVNHRGQVADPADIGQPPGTQVKMVARVDHAMDLLHQDDPPVGARFGLAGRDPLQGVAIVGGQRHQAVGEQLALIAKMAREAALD